SVGAFVKAVKAASGGKGRKGGAGKRRTRAVITSDTKSKVKALAEAGKTGGEIARAVGISVPSVQNIKKELGLTKARKK
ncbi:MAG: helix-turn-helix domain-containing protein, partial [Opitutales bacterium]